MRRQEISSSSIGSNSMLYVQKERNKSFPNSADDHHIEWNMLGICVCLCVCVRVRSLWQFIVHTEYNVGNFLFIKRKALETFSVVSLTIIYYSNG